MMSKKRSLPAWMNVCKVCKQDDEQTKEDWDTKSKSQSKEERKAEIGAAFDKMLTESLPEMIFTGSLVYSYHKADCSVLSEDIELAFCDVENAFMGFDMEWPVTFQVGKQDKTALLQLCTSSNTCYLFHLSCIGSLPAALCHLMQNKNIKKLGIGIESDLWKLERDYGIQVLSIIKESMVDLSHYANKVFKTSENWSLEGLVRHLFKCKINKDPLVRKSNWSHYPLTENQKTYAATDAYVCYKIYEKLQSMEKRV